MASETKALKRRTPKPRKLTFGMIDMITESIRKGNFPEVACALCNVSKASFVRWMRIGAKLEAEGREREEYTKEERLYIHFWDRVLRAQGESEDEELELIKQIALEKRDWQAIRWRLERRHPDRYGARMSAHIEPGPMDTSGKDVGQMDLSKLSREELLELDRMLAVMAGERPTESTDPDPSEWILSGNGDDLG